ncbi:MAG: 6-phosphofructokinase [Bdellovibrionales bacterium]|nr:6-phosphofructokinase [Bdellovibrionales bacterium]
MLGIPKIQSPQGKNKLSSIAILTSGGDAPGMNAAIRAVVRTALANNVKVFGVYKGYSGLLEGQIFPMTASSVGNIIQRGGTVLKTDRCEAFFQKSVRREAAHILTRKGIGGLIVIGGDGSFTGAHLLEKETGFPCIGVPGTIDNDIAGTDDTIGFDTAVNTAIEAIDRIRDTASSHDRIFLVEVMGAQSGFIALYTGVGGGAEIVYVPEAPLTLDQMKKVIERGMKRGKGSSIIVVAEGPKPGLAQDLSKGLSKSGYRPKVCILGHTQRGGTPSAHDRLLASALGSAAVGYLLQGKSNAMVGVQANEVRLIPFSKVIGKKKVLSPNLKDLVQTLSS